MRVQCKGCRIEFNVPDDKVPEGKALKILCPKCKHPGEINGQALSESNDHVACLPGNHQPGPGAERLLDDENSIDVVDEGVKTALLCDTNVKRAGRIAQALQELDLWVVHAMRPAFALGKLHHNNYDLIVLEENFNSGNGSDNLVLHHMQVIPMHLRRQFYLCILSPDRPTLDAKLAFRMGVNLILNVNDLEKAKVLFARAMKEHRNFYGLFNAELSKKG